MAEGAWAYAPFWCEENVWHLAGDDRLGPGERAVLVITGAQDLVACWNQRVARPGEPILWDYHVVLLQRSATWQVWDLDTRLGCPVSAADWLAGTFPFQSHVPPRFHPRFAWFPAEDWRRRFTSDRSHMRTASGGWQHPPPLWPSIHAGDLTLQDALAQAQEDLSALERRLDMRI